MSATNSTPTINLPLFIGTDKPAWLTDWNGSMNAIDSAIATLQTAESGTASALASLSQSVTALSGTVEQHTTAIQTVTTATATNTGNINTINSLIGNGTPTTTDQTLIGAINELNAGKAAKTDLGLQYVKLAEEITVTADGVKTWAQLLTEAIAAYSAVVSASTSAHKFMLRNINAGGTILEQNTGAVNVGGNAVGGSTFSTVNTFSGGCSTYCARCIADGSSTAYIIGAIASDGTSSITNSSSTVPASDTKVIIAYDELA